MSNKEKLNLSSGLYLNKDYTDVDTTDDGVDTTDGSNIITRIEDMFTGEKYNAD